MENRPLARAGSMFQIALWFCLLLYIAARFLQLCVGPISMLTIVVLHVVPSAAFALLHGARIYRWRGILTFTALCLGIGCLFESLSLRTGFPFGHYTFTPVMGPKIVDLPPHPAGARLRRHGLCLLDAGLGPPGQPQPATPEQSGHAPDRELPHGRLGSLDGSGLVDPSTTPGSGATVAPTSAFRSATTSAGSLPSSSSISSSHTISARNQQRSLPTGIALEDVHRLLCHLSSRQSPPRACPPRILSRRCNRTVPGPPAISSGPPSSSRSS